MSRRFRTKIVTNIFYSASDNLPDRGISHCQCIDDCKLSERDERYADSFLLQMTEINTLMVLIYVILGIAVFTVTFLTLLEKALLT